MLFGVVSPFRGSLTVWVGIPVLLAGSDCQSLRRGARLWSTARIAPEGASGLGANATARKEQKLSERRLITLGMVSASFLGCADWCLLVLGVSVAMDMAQPRGTGGQ